MVLEIEASSDTTSKLVDPPTSPRISFSSDFLDERDFISISPNSSLDEDAIESVIINGEDKEKACNFEFLSTQNSFPTHTTMLTADELFFEGKLLPYWQMQHAGERLGKINLKSSTEDEKKKSNNNNGNSGGKGEKGAEVRGAAPEPMSATTLMGTRSREEPRIWFIDDDPSPRPPKCTVLWKELLRLKKQRSASSLSPSPSSSSSSSTSSSSSSMGDHAAAATMEEGQQQPAMSAKEKHLRRLKKGLERTRSASIRIRPMVNVPICAQGGGKSSSLPPLFPLRLKKGLERTRSASIRIRPMVNVPICAQGGGKSSSLPPLFPLRRGKVER